MSIIMSAGNKKVEWSPKDDKVVKTASVQGEVKEEVNALYEAAKLVVEAGKDCKKCGSKKCECGGCKCEGKPCTCDKKEDKEAKVEDKKEVKAETEACEAPKTDVAPAAPKMDDKKDVVKVDLPPTGSPEGDVVVEPVAEEAAEATKMESAVEKIEEAVVDLKELVQEEKGELGGEVDEVEIEVDDAGVPGEEVSNSEIIVQSEPCMAKDKSKVSKVAATEEEFCRFAKLSPANKAKLANYWTNMLGYPKDWVDLLTKDYEK